MSDNAITNQLFKNGEHYSRKMLTATLQNSGDLIEGNSLNK